jgi:hypothetical protein
MQRNGLKPLRAAQSTLTRRGLNRAVSPNGRLTDALRYFHQSTSRLPRTALAAALAEIERTRELLIRLTGRDQQDHPSLELEGCMHGDRYLSLQELVKLIPYAPKTIYNKINKGELRRGYHYSQCGSRGRLIFSWNAMRSWVEAPPLRELRNGSRSETGIGRAHEDE